MKKNETTGASVANACVNVEFPASVNELTRFPHPDEKEKETGVFAWFLANATRSRAEVFPILSEERRTEVTELTAKIEELAKQVDSIYSRFYSSYWETVANIALSDFPDKGENVQKQRVKVVLDYFLEVNADKVFTTGEDLKKGICNVLAWHAKHAKRIERKKGIARVYAETFEALVNAGTLHKSLAYRLAVSAYDASMTK